MGSGWPVAESGSRDVLVWTASGGAESVWAAAGETDVTAGIGVEIDSSDTKAGSLFGKSTLGVMDLRGKGSGGARPGTLNKDFFGVSDAIAPDALLLSRLIVIPLSRLKPSVKSTDRVELEEPHRIRLMQTDLPSTLVLPEENLYPSGLLLTNLHYLLLLWIKIIISQRQILSFRFVHIA